MGWSITAAQQPDGVKNALDITAINTIRTLAIDAVQQANSEHPGTPIAMAPVTLALSRQALPTLDRDRYESAEGIEARVVSLPCWELFDDQDAAYRESVLPAAVTGRVSVEQGSQLGWAKYVGIKGTTIGMHSFGVSAPFEDAAEKVRFYG